MTNQPDRIGAEPIERAPETIAITAGREHNGGALATPLYSSTIFRPESLTAARRLAQQAKPTHFYSRHGNPSVAAFENAIAELEGAAAARAFSSGMGAISGVILALCSTGGHVVAGQQLYGGTRAFLENACPRFGIEVSFVDGTVPGSFAAAVIPGRTTLVIAETPANPRLDLVDLDEIGAIRGPFTLVDSTLATPLGQNPLAHGVDLVLHSATKGIGGNNDATLGVVAGERDLIDWIAGFGNLHGACASPAEAINGLRGLRTLAVRLRQQSATAQSLAETLSAHPGVASVRYPGLASHPQHELASRQLRCSGGLVTFELAAEAPKAAFDAGTAFVEALTLAVHAVSFGGPETLACHPASTTHAILDDDQLADAGIEMGTIRISCGLEDTADVIADIVGAIDRATG
jgi:cystathionine beta-lyase/cystathionine gamma-synthase